MLHVLTAEDVRRRDAEAEARGVSVEQLMENAGWVVAREAREMMGGTYGRRVVVVCGKGNNAGDGLVAARRLLEMGAHATVILVFEASSLNELAAKNLERFHGSVYGVEALKDEIVRADLVIDAIFGVGLTRAPEGPAEEAIRILAYAKQPSGGPISAGVLAVDVPSGLDSDTGQVYGPVSFYGHNPHAIIRETQGVVRADVTVTFSGYKPGLLFMPGRRCAGRVVVADIGTGFFDGDSVVTGFRQQWPVRAPGQHKRSSGVVLVVAGSLPMPGAAVLTSAASVHTGSGLTTLCAPREACALALSRVPEMTTIPYDAGAEGVLHQKVVDALIERLDEFDVIAIGPGLTTHPAAVQAVRNLVRATDKPVVLDADGINAFVGAPGLLRERDANSAVLTPHAGELSRLVGVPAAELERDRLGKAKKIAQDLRSVLVFKGPGTVTAARIPVTGGNHTFCFVNNTGTAALAQGGTGDVLTGMVASALAQEHGRFRIGHEINMFRAAAAVWLHGRAAERLAARVWPHPANASALVDEIGPTLHEVMNL